MSEIITLKLNKDFRRLYSRGKSYVSPILVTYVCKNKNHSIRYGITTSKKIGKAVVRNKAKRLVREAYRELLPEIKSGYDFVFVARGKTPYVKSYNIKKCMQEHMKKAGVLK